MSFFSIDQMEFAIVTILTMVNDLFHTKILQHAVVNSLSYFFFMFYYYDLTLSCCKTGDLPAVKLLGSC